MSRDHHYRVTVTWTGNLGEGTSGYRSYSRDHDVTGDGKTPLAASSDPAFRGDPSRWNPEELLVAALSQCHMLWYLHLCSQSDIVVTAYSDDAAGTMVDDDGGHFTEAVLRPQVTVAAAESIARAEALHEEAHKRCFIANSVNFRVRVEPRVSA